MVLWLLLQQTTCRMYLYLPHHFGESVTYDNLLQTLSMLVTSKAKFYIHHKSDGWKNLDEVSSCILSRIHVGFMVDKVALGQLFLPAFQFYPVCIIPQMVTFIHSPITNTLCSQKLTASLNYKINIICTDNENPKNVKNLHVS